MKVFLIAGEPSGDRLGAALMAGLKTLCPEVTFAGVGGDAMAEEGLVSLFDMSELSVMGIAEVLPRYPHLVRRMKETVAAVLRSGADVIITIDSPDFCLRVLKRVRAAKPDLRTVHYVAPSVWAWRPHRADRMAGLVDQVLCLLPFEPPYMEKAGIRADFVGHPVVAEPVPSDAEVAAFRSEQGLGAAPVLLVLPGSRGGEVARLAPVFGEALRPVLAARPDLRVVVPAAARVAGQVAEQVTAWPGAPVVLDPREQRDEDAQRTKRRAFRAAAGALAASGTVSLELAAQGTPMVIAYDMAWLSMKIMERMALIDTVTLVNLVSDSRVVEEFLGKACTPEAIAGGLDRLLSDPSVQHAALDLTMDRLGRGGEAPGLRAARAVLDGMGKRIDA